MEISNQLMTGKSWLLTFRTTKAVNVANELLTQGPFDDDGQFLFDINRTEVMYENDLYFTHFQYEAPQLGLVDGVDYLIEDR